MTAQAIYIKDLKEKYDKLLKAHVLTLKMLNEIQTELSETYTEIWNENIPDYERLTDEQRANAKPDLSPLTARYMRVIGDLAMSFAEIFKMNNEELELGFDWKDYEEE